MAEQLVDITISIPVKAFLRLKPTWILGGPTITPTVHDSAVTAVTEAALQSIKVSTDFFFEISVGTFDTMYPLWCEVNWRVSKVWEQLERIHGIKQGGRKLSYAGKELVEDDQVSHHFGFRFPRREIC
jgi:hypothetical protein